MSTRSRSVLSPTASKREIYLLRSLDSLAMEWRTAKASHALNALLKSGWRIKRQKGSHRILIKSGYPRYTFAFQDKEEIGPRMLARIAKHTGLTPDRL
jgi:predicted RNA binding protein YcfA (HicA-like mRNA interferase family)